MGYNCQTKGHIFIVILGSLNEKKKRQRETSYPGQREKECQQQLRNSCFLGLGSHLDPWNSI